MEEVYFVDFAGQKYRFRPEDHQEVADIQVASDWGRRYYYVSSRYVVVKVTWYLNSQNQVEVLDIPSFVGEMQRFSHHRFEWVPEEGAKTYPAYFLAHHEAW